MTNYNYSNRTQLINFSEKVTKVCSVLIFFSFVIPIFVLNIFFPFENSYSIYLCLFFILTVLTYYINKALFSTVFFFFLLHATTPINTAFVNFIGINFLGVYYLIPILIFTLFIIISAPTRKTIDWWRREIIDFRTVILIVLLSFSSGIFLYIWGVNNLVYINDFAAKLPKGSLAYVFISGVAFAAFNALAEEYMSRGMLCNGLDKLFENKTLKIFIQALMFSLFHYYGFPGGWIGVAMVFTWSIFLGVIRYRTKGLLGVLISHFFADLTIYFILYSLF